MFLNSDLPERNIKYIFRLDNARLTMPFSFHIFDLQRTAKGLKNKYLKANDNYDMLNISERIQSERWQKYID